MLGVWDVGCSCLGFQVFCSSHCDVIDWRHLAERTKKYERLDDPEFLTVVFELEARKGFGFSVQRFGVELLGLVLDMLDELVAEAVDSEAPVENSRDR